MVEQSASPFARGDLAVIDSMIDAAALAAALD
jgi:hypothetical protein